MGGDHGPSVTVPAAIDFISRHREDRVILVGLSAAIDAELRHVGPDLRARVKVVHASEVVEMDDAPAVALRSKKDSSIRVAVELVKSGEAQAFVSAGNTGALMAISRFVLKTLPGIDRPAIVSVLPSMKGSTYMLDLGANVDCGPEHLLQFAVMGSILAAAVEHKERPTVGLLNIGEEAIKGNEVVKKASELLRESGLNFIGNVEGKDLTELMADVIVCDGFIGNVALKTSEGLAQFFAKSLREEFSRSYFSRFSALIAWPAISAFRRRFDHRNYNGATLIGLNGVVVKSHGSADVFSFTRAIERSVEEVRGSVLSRIASHFPGVVA